MEHHRPNHDPPGRRQGLDTYPCPHGPERVGTAVTPEDWDTHWYRIRNQALMDGREPIEAEVLADVETAEQFGARPGQEQATA